MRRIPLLFAMLALSACVRSSTNPATGEVDVDVESPTKTGEDWKASFGGQGMFSAMKLNATALVASGMTDVRFGLTGGTPGQTHPWHVHEGKCGTGGPIFGDPSAYSPITVGADGNGQANAHLMARLDEAKDYHINVHASASEMATIIACGDLDD